MKPDCGPTYRHSFKHHCVGVILTGLEPSPSRRLLFYCIRGFAQVLYYINVTILFIIDINGDGELDAEEVEALFEAEVRSVYKLFF